MCKLEGARGVGLWSRVVIAGTCSGPRRQVVGMDDIEPPSGPVQLLCTVCGDPVEDPPGTTLHYCSQECQRTAAQNAAALCDGIEAVDLLSDFQPRDSRLKRLRHERRMQEIREMDIEAWARGQVGGRDAE